MKAFALLQLVIDLFIQLIEFKDCIVLNIHEVDVLVDAFSLRPILLFKSIYLCIGYYCQLHVMAIIEFFNFYITIVGKHSTKWL